MAIVQTIPAGDLEISGGRLARASGIEHTTNKLAMRLAFFKGEWFLDTREGVPYFRDVFRKDPQLDVIRSVFSQVIRKCPGILALRSLSVKFDAATRELTVGFEAISEAGVITIRPGEDERFIVTV